MAKNNSQLSPNKNSPAKNKVSQETVDESLAIAKSTQRPGQSKEQTRLIAQGIQKGIDQYKKQQKAKAREQDKIKKKNTRQQAARVTTAPETETKPAVQYRQPMLPWVLLAMTWAGIGVYYAFLMP